MSDQTVRLLAWAQFDFAHASQALSELAQTMERCASEVPACRAASHRINRSRRLLMNALVVVDRDLSDAIQAADGLT